MSDKDLNEKNVERICNDELTRRAIVKIIGARPAELMQPDMRPHTWIFLRQDNKQVPVICLGIVFNTWPMNKFNMVRFTAHDRASDKEVTTSGRLTKLDNGADGLVLDVRWPWMTMMKKYRGLSAGDL